MIDTPGPVVPRKLRAGDLVRVVAPSTSLARLGDDNTVHVDRALGRLGLRYDLGRHVRERDAFDSSSIRTRVEDLHQAFADPAVAGILTAIGGFNANQLLRHLDWDRVARSPKVFCGYSDITSLGNAMLRKAGLVTYSGPHWSTFGMRDGIEYTIDGFRRAVMEEGAYEVEPSPVYSDDRWFADQDDRRFLANPGPRTLAPGVAEGQAVGGNLCTLNLLQGTEYMPALAGAVVFVEEDAQAGPLGAVELDRNLQSLLHVEGAEDIRGLVIGRFQPASGVTPETLAAIVATKPELRGIPVACGFDFGHTAPHFTFPIGGRVRLDCTGERARLFVLEH